jgi:hypothetical protein
VTTHKIVEFLNLCVSADEAAELGSPWEFIFKRRIIDIHSPRKDDNDLWVCDACSWLHPEIRQLINAYAPCEHLQLMSMIYAERAGFDPVWISDVIGFTEFPSV